LYFKAEEEGIKGADRSQNKISFAFSKLNSIIGGGARYVPIILNATTLLSYNVED